MRRHRLVRRPCASRTRGLEPTDVGLIRKGRYAARTRGFASRPDPDPPCQVPGASLYAGLRAWLRHRPISRTRSTPGRAAPLPPRIRCASAGIRLRRRGAFRRKPPASAGSERGSSRGLRGIGTWTRPPSTRRARLFKRAPHAPPRPQPAKTNTHWTCPEKCVVQLRRLRSDDMGRPTAVRTSDLSKPKGKPPRRRLSEKDRP